MTDKPISFDTPVLDAIRENRKTQFRTMFKLPEKQFEHPQMGGWESTTNGGGGAFRIARDGSRIPVPETIGIWHQTSGKAFDAPYQVGDRLWIREKHRFRGASYNDGENGETNWSEEEWFRCHGAAGPGDSWDPKFPSGWYPANNMAIESLTGPGWETDDDGIRNVATPYLSSTRMPRWASRTTLIVTDVVVGRLQNITDADAQAEGIRQMRDGSGTFVGREGPGKLVTPWPTAKEAFLDIWDSIHGHKASDANPWVTTVTFRVEHQNIDAIKFD